MNRLPSLSKVVIKALEITGAGLASAFAAFLIGRVETPTPPPALSPVVYLAPADEEMMRAMRSDQAALLEQLRNDSQLRQAQAASEDTSQGTPVPQVPSPAAASPAEVPPSPAAAKPVKSALVARRDHKPEHARAADAKPRVEPIVEQPRQIQPAMTAATSPRDIAVASGVATAPAPPAESDSALTSTFKHITAWLLPSRDRTPENTPPGSVPRPPKPVGDFLPSAM
jgi:hypothetical protein